MPATRRESQDLPVIEPYILVGAPKPQLAALTVNALRSHLKHYHLATTGNKAALVDRLHNHLSSFQPGNTNPASAAGSQTTTSVANTNSSVGSQSTTSVTHTTNSNAQPANSTTQSTHSGALALPQQLVEQLATYLQQHQTTTAGNQGNTVDDDNLSVASGPTHTTMVAPIQMATSTTAVASATLAPSATLARTSLLTIIPALPTLSSPMPPVNLTRTQLPVNITRTQLPVIPTRVRDKIVRGEYIDFASLLSKSMFSTHNPLSQQSVTLRLNSDNDSFTVQPAVPHSTSSQRISSFASWMEAWNVYLSVRTVFNPSCAAELIRYQCIIISANSDHPISEWLNYDVKFRTKAANDPSLRWDTRDTDLWLECMTSKAMQSQRWPCPHCGTTNHFPDRCPFHPSSSSIGISNVGTSDTGPGTRRRAPGHSSHPRRAQLQPPICHDYNNAVYHRPYCNYLHKCDYCGGDHLVRSCLSRRQPRRP